MIAYPEDLPCVSRVEGHSTVADAGVVRSPIEGGATRQRRAQQRMPHRISLVFVIDQADYARWLLWINAHAFDGYVGLQLPGVLASRAGTDTALVPVRLVSDVQAELIPAHRLWFWRCRVEAEWLPSAGDLALIPIGGWIVGGHPATPSPGWIVAGTPGAPSQNRILAGTASAPNAWI